MPGPLRAWSTPTARRTGRRGPGPVRRRRGGVRSPASVRRRRPTRHPDRRDRAARRVEPGVDATACAAASSATIAASSCSSVSLVVGRSLHSSLASAVVIAASTSSIVPRPSMVIHRSGSRSAIVRKPSMTRWWKASPADSNRSRSRPRSRSAIRSSGVSRKTTDLWPSARDRPVVDLLELLDRQAAAESLIGERRVERAIADHVAACVECRCDDLGDVLGPIGCGHQCLGTSGEVGDGVVVQDLAQTCTDRVCRRSRV